MISRPTFVGSLLRLLLLALLAQGAPELRAELVGYWDFNNSGNVGADAGPTGNHLTSFGGAGFTASGKNGGGLLLNGGQYLAPASGSLAKLPTGNSAYSMVAWFNAAATGDRGIMGFGTWGAARSVNAIRLISGTNIINYWWGVDITGAPNPTYAVNTWHHMAATYDGTTRRLYFDGAQVSQDTPGANGSVNVNFRVGSTNNGEYFSGTLDDVAIFNTALTSAQILALANGAKLPSTVDNGVAVASFTATPTSFLPGQDVTLNWVTSQATGVAIDQGLGTVVASGSVVVHPTAEATYTITAQGVGGPASLSAVVKPVTAPQLLHRWSFNEASGTAVTDSVGTAHGTIVGTGWTRANGEVQLPGGSSASAPYIDLPNGLISGLDDVTLEGWMTLPALPVGQTRPWQRVFDFGTTNLGEITGVGASGTTVGYDGVQLAAQVSDNRAVKLLSMRDNNAELNTTVNDPIVDGQPFHFAVTYSATGNNGQPQLRYYKNGALVGTLNTTARLRDMTDNNNWLGRSQFSGDSNTLGNYDEFRMWNVPLAESAIQNAYAAGPNALPASQIVAFEALSPTIEQGQSVRLSYVLTDLQGGTVTIDHGAPAVVGTSGFVTVTPSATTTYTLTVTNGAITRTAQTTVGVKVTAPTAYDRELRVAYNQPVTVAFAASDPNTPLGSLTYAIGTPPSHGTLTGTGATRTYTPAPGYSGLDVFSYRANDGSTDSNVAVVTLTISKPPAPPTLIGLSASTILDTTAAGAYIGDFTATDVNFEDTFAYTLVGGPGGEQNGNFSIVGRQLRAATSFTALSGQAQHLRVQVTDSAGQSYVQTFTLSVTPPVRGVVINEFHFNPVDNTLAAEFIELYNNGTSAVSLTGWRLSGAVDYLFPSGTTIAAGGYLLIAEKPGVIQARWGKIALGPWDGNLSSDGEVIRLRDANDTTVCAVDYKVGFPWPVAADGEGASAELINPMLDPSVGSNWRASAIPAAGATTDSATPGAQNAQFSTNAAPAIRKVEHLPEQPKSFDPIVVRALVTDPDGVAAVELQYQIVTPGNFVPSTQPRAISGGNFVGVTAAIPNPPLPANPAFESAANWTTVPMADAGGLSDSVSGDGIYTATIPAQVNRTLVRYRIKVTDNLGATARVPYADDASLNFACYVYNGVPDYEGTPASELTRLPVYHFLTRAADYTQAIAMQDNLSARLVAGPSWSYENWEAAFVYNGKVYDHLKYRLHGGNGRYSAGGSTVVGAYGKRAFKFIFNKGAYFQGQDNDGKAYPVPWKTIITENLWENRGTQTFSLNEAVNFRLWNEIGVPAPLGHWAHFRTVKQVDEQPDPYFGDFWGLIYMHEDYDKQFLDTHKLEPGNVYKMTRDNVTGLSQQRYQAPLAVKDGSDHDELLNNLRGTSPTAFITSRVNLDEWFRYHAVAEAVRHYDYWPTGDNNAAWYFFPNYTAANGNKGEMWTMPSDTDATWGPTWNAGHDLVHNALFNDAGDIGGDSATHPELWPGYYNQVREVRDLLWQPDQISPLIDEDAAIIRPFVNADYKRWYGAPNAAGNHSGFNGPGMTSAIGQVSLAAYVQDMKNFAFVGGTWTDQGVGVGGRAAFLDTKQAENGEGSLIPNQPTISFVGAAGFPVNDLRFQTSAFSDPQGAGTFAGVQWRIAEVNTTSTYLPGEPRLLEIVARYQSGAVAPFAAVYRFPSAACEPGKRYRARVRHLDATGRASKWSAAVEFTAGTYDPTPISNRLVVSELMYHSAAPTVAEQSVAAGLGQTWTDDDFDYLELRNVSAGSVDLSDLRFSTGVDFTFPTNSTLAAGASILVVQNVAAFQARYGVGKPIVGAWEATDKLKNSSETITFRYGDIDPPLFRFTYADVAPWPTTPDGTGPSLVLMNPESLPDMNDPANWRASFATTPGGNPGSDDRPSFATWAAGQGVSDPAADPDGDGLTNLMEFALGGQAKSNSQGVLPKQGVQAFDLTGTPENYLTIAFTRVTDPADVTFTVQFADALPNWQANGVLVNSVQHADGTTTQTWRAPQPMSVAKYFARVKVVK